MTEQQKHDLEELKRKLSFKTTTIEGAQIIVSTRYKGLYRQYSYHIGAGGTQLLDEEIKNILTKSMMDALRRKI